MFSEYKTKEEVHKRAEQIIGIPFKKLAKNRKSSQKNYVGDIFEEWFGKSKDSSSEADLEIVELKTTPYRELKNGNYSSKERLVLNIINYMELVNEDFENSHFLKKNSVIELGFYEKKDTELKENLSFSDVALYEMEKNPLDYKVIRKDWNKIQEYVSEGNAESLSEGLTDYLSACTKGGGHGNDLRSQPCSDKKAKQRAFALKQGYMTQMLRKYILGDKKIDSLITSENNLENDSLRNTIDKRLSRYIGKTKNELAVMLNISSTAYQLNNQLIRGMLGLDKKSSRNYLDIDELNKAMYYFKTVQFDEKGFNKENMSLPAFKFKDICNETWTDSEGYPSATLNTILSEGIFVICVFQYSKTGENIFKGIKFYNFPQSDIDNEIKKCWIETIKVLKNGVVLTYNGSRVENNLPKKSNSDVIHVRPHTKKASYVNNIFSNELPVKAHWINKPRDYSDNYMTNQCFFINNTYIKKIVKSLLD